MSATLLPNAKQTFTGPNGAPLSGGSVYFYIPNTTTPKNTWQDSAQTILNTNPVVLDANGQAVIWGSGTYRQVVYDANNNLIWDQITEDVSADLIGNFTDAIYNSGTDFTPGTTTTLTLPVGPGSATNTWVFFDAAYQTDSTYTINGTTLTFTSAIPVGVSVVTVKIGTTVSIGIPGAGTVSDASVAAGTALYNRIANYYDVMDPRFGAKGDGVTDDTAAIQAAINYVGGLGGGVVHIPDKKFLVSSPIVFGQANVELLGNGKYANSINVPNNAANFIGYNPNAVFILNANNCGISQIGMNGNIANNASLSFGAISNTVAVSGIYVEDCYIHDFIYNGIVFNPLTGTTSNFRIDRNRVENIGWGAITAYCSMHGTINENSVTSCGADGIQTGYNSNTGNFNFAQFVTIDGNYVTKATPPTHIVGGATEGGFMIVVGAGDSYITISNNLCYDNRNAAQDGIGLGQDGTRVNEGLVTSNNVVIYAGLYGIDVSSNHIVSGNYIRYSAQQGIKLGTDVGGNLVDATVVDNIIDSCNLAGSGSSQGIWVNATLTASLPTALYENIKINGNRVIDFNGTPNTKYGLGIGFQNNLTYLNCEFNNNDFSQLSGLNGNGVTFSGTPAAFSGWSYRGNKHPNALPVITGNSPNVLGLDAAAVSQPGATNLIQLNGVYSGQEITLQMGDGNTTFVTGGNILIHAASSQAAASNSIYKLFCYSGGCYLNQFFTP